MQAAIYLAVAPKSDASYQALNRVMEAVENWRAEPVPFHLRNAPTGAMKQWGYGAGYQHAHKFAEAMPDMECLPESLAGTRFYEPTGRGAEEKIAQRMEEIRARRKASRESPQK
jgi:putative ATPase